MWSNKVHRIQNPQRVYRPPKTFSVCGGRNWTPSPTAPHWLSAMAVTASGTTRSSVWLKPAEFESCSNSNFQQWGGVPGLIPLKYARISIFSAPYSTQDLVMPTKKGAYEGPRFHQARFLWRFPHGHLIVTFKTFKAAGSFNDWFSQSRFMACADLPWNCHYLWWCPEGGYFYFNVDYWVWNTQNTGRPDYPDLFSSECTVVHRPKCCWEDVIGSWLHYFVNRNKKESPSWPQDFQSCQCQSLPPQLWQTPNPQRTKAMVPARKGSF